ncbi:hypothetical protein BpHYR1_027187 [Brachionus plicatilis]|uniref:Uncharacterized protein n=1 Tax=Brachionus plicatilis TaxID=10195 RepID=A0A3M7QPH2_BRAPC|nr:hypothetical protein BpHYR1_027187 [Brachionus plicatilis]
MAKDINKIQTSHGWATDLNETEMIVKKALSKYTNPVAWNICGELMKNVLTYFRFDITKIFYTFFPLKNDHNFWHH